MARTKTTAAAQQAAMAGGYSVTYPPQQGVVYGGGGVNIGGIGGGWQPSPNFNYNGTTTITVKEPQTALDLFEELIGLIGQLEDRLNLDPKDKSKHAYLELIMGRIQEDVINETIQRLKALKI